MKNFILKTWAYLNLIIWIFAACAIDSDSWIPAIVVCVVTVKLAIFAYANDWFEGYCR